MLAIRRTAPADLEQAAVLAPGGGPALLTLPSPRVRGSFHESLLSEAGDLDLSTLSLYETSTADSWDLYPPQEGEGSAPQPVGSSSGQSVVSTSSDSADPAPQQGAPETSPYTCEHCDYKGSINGDLENHKKKSHLLLLSPDLPLPLLLGADRPLHLPFPQAKGHSPP